MCSINLIQPWNSMIIGYVKNSEPQRALITYFEMRDSWRYASKCTFLVLIKGCGEIQDAKAGSELHIHIAKRGLESDQFLGSSLIDMYAKCGSLVKARETFEKLPLKDVVSWNVLMGGYMSLGYDIEAIDCYQKMVSGGIIPSQASFLCGLKACGSIGAIDKGREIHAEICRRRLEEDVHIGTNLVDMYSNFVLFGKAREVFEKLSSVRNVVTWNVLITGYVNHGLSHEALDFYEKLHLDGISENPTTFSCVVKACGITSNIEKGQELHSKITRKGFECDIFIGTALVDMYANCGWLSEACVVFEKLPVRNVVTWNTLIGAYAKCGDNLAALGCLVRMEVDGFSPNPITYICILKACGELEDLDNGTEILVDVTIKGMEMDPFVAYTLVDMYANCGFLAEAQNMSDALHIRNVVSWTALIGGYVKYGLDQEALDCFQQMQIEGVSPNTFTYASILKACGNIRARDKGEKIHLEIESQALLAADHVLTNVLIDMYAKCGLLKRAHEAFRRLIEPSIVSWNTLMGGYARHGYGEETWTIFLQMKFDGFTPDAISYGCVLQACATIRMVAKGRRIHAEIEKERLLETDLILGNMLVDMYATCGVLVNAVEVFDNARVRDVVSWTSLMAGYIKYECFDDVTNYFECMQFEGIVPNSVTFVCVLKACGNMGISQKGQYLHIEIVKKGMLEKHPTVGNSIIDMYAKCGFMPEAHEVSDKLPNQDLVSWNALISGYAQLGASEVVIRLIEEMLQNDQELDKVTLISALNACSHAGLVDTGALIFHAIHEVYRFMPCIEHHVCLADICGRAGQLQNAIAMVEGMPFHPNHVMWHSILTACTKWGDIELGRQAFAHAIHVDGNDAVAAYLCLSKLYFDIQNVVMEEEI